jgi:hypothetical protein
MPEPNADPTEPAPKPKPKPKPKSGRACTSCGAAIPAQGGFCPGCGLPASGDPKPVTLSDDDVGRVADRVLSLVKGSENAPEEEDHEEGEDIEHVAPVATDWRDDVNRTLADVGLTFD